MLGDGRAPHVWGDREAEHFASKFSQELKYSRRQFSSSSMKRTSTHSSDFPRGEGRSSCTRLFQNRDVCCQLSLNTPRRKPAMKNSPQTHFPLNNFTAHATCIVNYLLLRRGIVWHNVYTIPKTETYGKATGFVLVWKHGVVFRSGRTETFWNDDADDAHVLYLIGSLPDRFLSDTIRRPAVKANCR